MDSEAPLPVVTQSLTQEQRQRIISHDDVTHPHSMPSPLTSDHLPLPSSISLPRSIPLLSSLPSLLPSSSSSPSLYRRLSSRLSTPPSSSTIPMPLPPPHAHSRPSSLHPPPSSPHKPPPPTSSPPTITPLPPLPLPTSSLPSHSLHLLLTTHHLTVLSSLSYLLFNFLRSFYHQHSHWPGWMWVADVALFATNVVMMGGGVSYWVAYVERKRWDWEVGGREGGRGGREGKGMDKAGEGEEGEQAGLLPHVAVGTDSPPSPSSSSSSPSSSSSSSPSPSPSPHSPSLPTSPSPPHPLPLFSPFPSPLVWSIFFLSLFHSSTFYLRSLPGLAELLNLTGTLLYLLSSLIPLTLSSITFFHLSPLTEATEATLDELQYALDALAMTLYTVGSLLYMHLWHAHARDGGKKGVGGAEGGWRGVVWRYVWDTALWANVWNVAGCVCYAVSVYYGLAIRVHTADMERIRGGVGLAGEGGVVSSGVLAADDLRDLSEWQRALYGLTLQQKALMSMGDLLYVACALMTQRGEALAAVAKEEGRSRRRGKGVGRWKGRSGGGGGSPGVESISLPLADPKSPTPPLTLTEVEVK